MAIKIRSYRADDRASVRKICFDTGLMGNPIAAQYGDPESFADMFTAYYTDHEPEHCFVVDDDGRVLGYVVGTLDTRKVPRPESVIARHVLTRALPLRKHMARFMALSAADGARDALAGVQKLHPDLERFPAHCHFNLLAEARQAPIAAALIRSFMLAAKKAGCPGMHGEVFAENTRAAQLHEAMGFQRAGEPVLTPGMRGANGERLHVQLWTRKL